MERIVLLLALAGCLESSTVRCDDGTVCRVGTSCHTIAAFDGTPLPMCATDEEVAACATPPIADGEPCALKDVAAARCYAGVCLPAGCGNGLADPQEVCDDGNTAVGDGCSADCRSHELCRDGHLDRATGEVCDDGNAVGHDGCTGTCAAEVPHWIDVGATLPDASAFSLAYDARRDVVVYYGGFGFTGDPAHATGDLLTDVWEWSGRAWSRIPATTTPPGRYYGSMAYDASRARTVLYGGLGRGAEVWEWSGDAWTSIDPPAGPAPSANASTSLVYDPLHADTVACDATACFTWDGRAWASAQTFADPANASILGFDPVRGAVVLVRALQTSAVAVWELAADGTWRDVTPATFPAAITNLFGTVRLVWEPGLGVLVLTSGDDGWYAWDGHAFAPAIEPPESGFDLDVVGTAHGLVAVVKGGATYVRPAGGAWQLVAASSPAARTGAVAVADPLGHRALVVGGDANSQDGRSAVDAWAWDGAWTRLADLPIGRAEAAGAYDLAHDALVVFGGAPTFEATVSTLADTWLYRDATGWTQITGAIHPPARSGAAMAFDAARGETVLFGGRDADAVLGDTWTFDGAAWHALTPTASPSARAGAGLAFDPIRRRTILFGGTDADGDALAGCADPDCWATCTPLVPPGAPVPTAPRTDPRCGDGVCDPRRETCTTCPSDCACAPICGDFRCDAPAETHASCPGDCP